MPRLTGEYTEWKDMPNDPDKGRIKIKHLKRGETNDIEDQIELYETMLRTDAEGNVQREVKINQAKGDKRYAHLCASLVDWENFFDAEGKPMPCTDENKIRMARDDERFAPLVGKFRTELAEKVAREREAAEKNSQS